MELLMAFTAETQLVGASSTQRPVGDTSTSAVWVTDLPSRFFGGQESLQWCLSEIVAREVNKMYAGRPACFIKIST